MSVTPPFKSIDEAAAQVVADLRFQQNVRRLHIHGPRVLAELLAEIGAERGIQTIIDDKVARYAALDPEALDVTGGHDFRPAPIHEVA